MTHIANLNIRALELIVFLGWPDNERKEAQVVWLDIEIAYAQSPQACVSDDLKDTLCYSSLIDFIQTTLAGKYFHLIEHLAHEVFNVVRTKLNNDDKLSVSITKHPKIPGLTGGVCFSLRG